MALKRVTGVRYDLDLPDGRKIKYRGLKTGEQKNLLAAIELNDSNGVINTLSDIMLQATNGEFDGDKEPMYLADYLMLKIHMRANGANAPAVFECGGRLYDEEAGEEKPCGNKMNVMLDLDRAAVDFPDDYKETDIVSVGDNSSIHLRVPTFAALKRLDGNGDWKDAADKFIYAAIEKIVIDGEPNVPGVDFTYPEMVEWLNDLEVNVVESVAKFFDKLPSVLLKLDITCPKCGGKEVFELRNLESFFQ